MTPKQMIEPSTNAKIKKKAELEDALLILENETQKRIKKIRQEVEFTCASIRAQGTAHLNKMLKSVRELTVAEYCETYRGGTGRFLEKEQQRLENKKAHNEIQDSIMKKQSTETLDSNNKKSHNKTLDPTMKKQSTETQDTTTKRRISEMVDSVIKKRREEIPPNHGFGPLFVHIEREDHPNFSIRLDPERTATEKFKLNAPTEILTHLNDTQRSTVRDQIQDLQDQLTKLQESLS